MSRKISLTLLSFFLLLSALVLVFPLEKRAGTVPQKNPDGLSFSSTHSLFIAGTEVRVAIADTPSLRERGLSGAVALGENQGMLFIFENPAVYQFWTKEMLFPIDIFWIDENANIVHVTENATPDSYPKTFASPTPVRYVLEVPAGFASRHNIKKGVRVMLPLP